MSVVLLFVLVVDASSESAASAIAASTADEREGRTSVLLERVSALPTEADALARATVVGATDVFEVSWPDADGRHAHVHAHLATKPAWLDRELAFEAKSPAWERGRAVGLAIASMLPDEPTATTTIATPTTTTIATATPTATTTATATATPTTTAPSTATPTATTTATAPPDPPADLPLTPRPSSRPSLQLALAFETSPGTSPSAWSSGGALEVGLALTPRLRLLGTMRARASSIEAVGARTWLAQGGLGAAYRWLGGADGLALDGAVELRVARWSASRTNLAGVDETQSRYAPAVAVRVEGSLPLSGSWSAIVALGGELPLGQTTITINGEAAAELPRFALVGDAGARWRF